MKGYASIQLLGNLTREPELRTTKSGKSVASFTVAVNSAKDKVTYYNCSAWEKTAELINEYAKKGSGIFVVGSPDIQTYEKDGVKQSRLEVTVREFYLTDKAIENRPLKQHEAIERAQDVVPELDDKPIDLNEIPF